MPPPSSPRRDSTNSPRLVVSPAARATPFTGRPKCRAIAGDQSTSSPTLAGWNGVCRRRRSSPPRRRPNPAAASSPRRRPGPRRPGVRARRPSGVSKAQSAIVPAGPAPAGPQRHPQPVQPPQPGPQQRRRLHRHRKHPAGRAGEDLLPQLPRPVHHLGRTELGDRVRHRRRQARAIPLAGTPPSAGPSSGSARTCRPSAACGPARASPRRPSPEARRAPSPRPPSAPPARRRRRARLPAPRRPSDHRPGDCIGPDLPPLPAPDPGRGAGRASTTSSRASRAARAGRRS